MDSGIEQLTDDQLVELLQELCAEAARRDPFVRRAAQVAIDHEANKLKAIRESAFRTIRSFEDKESDLESAIKMAVERTHQEYVQQLRTDVMEAVREDFKNGLYTPIPPAQEAAVIASAAQQANDALLQNVDPKLYDADRRAVMNNLKRMGHSVEDIERMYGKF